MNIGIVNIYINGIIIILLNINCKYVGLTTNVITNSTVATNINGVNENIIIFDKELIRSHRLCALFHTNNMSLHDAPTHHRFRCLNNVLKVIGTCV